MRKIFLFTAAMLAIAGCSEDNTHPKVSPVDEPSADAVTILATIDAIPSATGDGEAYAPLWQEGDQIVVGYKGISYVYETYDAGNGVEFHPMALSLPADARGEVTAYFKAVDGVFAVGADQTGATLPMYAYAADAAPAQGSLGLHFKPLASVLSLTIGEEASKTISKITLEPVDPDGVEGHLAVSEAVVDPRTGAVTVGEDAAVSDILTMEIGEMSLVQAQTVNFLIASGTKVDGGLKATISCTDGSIFVKNLFEGQEVAFAGNCVGAATELFFRLRIATYEDMVNFAQECADDNGGAIVDLQADIDMRNVPWTPVENFTGTFNGNGHRIYNINVSADGRYAGFFAYAKGAISDVVFGSKDGTSYDGTSRIELKYSADTDTWCYAGIVAQSNNTLTGVTSFVPVTVTADSRCKSRTGGIVGSLYNGKMSGCRNYGAVSNVATAGVASYVAGIAGIVDGSGDAAGAITLDGCHNHGPVMTSLGLGNAVAGITASVMKTAVNTTISNCTNAGEIRFDNAGTSAAHRIGGIVVVYDGETRLEKLTVPANVKFDAEAVYSDKLTLEWDEVPGAASYTVAWWADGTEEKDATVAEGITSASYLLKELEAGTEYHAKVKACRYNNPGYDSDYSAVVSQKTDIAPVQAGIVVSKVLATSSTLTVEWARADGQACVNSSAQVYHVKLYSDAECKDLVVGWNASNVFGITAGNRFRFTFSGLAPATTYYVCVDDKTNDFFSDPLAYATAAAGPQAGATTAGSAKAGDILLAEDFSRVIHGGDIANFAAGYYPPSSNRGTYAAASGDNPSGFSATRCTANEFDVFSGGGVAAPYTEGTGLAAWGKSGNIAGRPGYVKMGAGSAAASLYTPELTALPDAATVKVRFSAQAYSEKYDGSGADAGKILVKAVRGAVLGAKGAITGTVTEVSAADPVDISAAKARFREFEATLTNVTPDCRIVISTSEKRALLDNVVVTCTAITPATKPAAPGGVSFDAAAAADRLTLKWNAVPDATSYTVAYWKGSASAPESEYAYKTGIASTATSQELTNLESNTSYWAKVKAVGSLDSDWSETANATTMDSGGEPLLPTADLLDVVFRNDGSAMDNSSSATPVRRMPSSRP
ncbi:MAG: fibronectin type III domain-containing protein [Alistipes onderdonkii]